MPSSMTAQHAHSACSMACSDFHPACPACLRACSACILGMLAGHARCQPGMLSMP
jgi:hypothetical protein